MRTGWVVVYSFNMQNGSREGDPIRRDGHFKIYGNPKSAKRRASSLSSGAGIRYATVKEISYSIG